MESDLFFLWKPSTLQRLDEYKFLKMKKIAVKLDVGESNAKEFCKNLEELLFRSLSPLSILSKVKLES